MSSSIIIYKQKGTNIVMNIFSELKLKLSVILSRRFWKEINTVDYINGADSLPPPLSKEDEQKAFELIKTDEKKPESFL